MKSEAITRRPGGNL